MKSLILEGFMGCGKSRIAFELGKELKLRVLDTDKLIESRQEKSISDIFKDEGEEAFRDMETEQLELLTKDEQSYIISLGGGMPCRKENRELLKKLGKVVYLRAEPEVLIKRLERGVEKRPMLSGHDLEQRVKELLEKRKGDYEEAADIIVDIGNEDVKTVTARVRKAMDI